MSENKQINIPTTDEKGVETVNSQQPEINEEKYLHIVDLTGRTDKEIIELAKNRLTEEVEELRKLKDDKKKNQQELQNAALACMFYEYMVNDGINDVNLAKATLIKCKSLLSAANYMYNLAYKTRKEHNGWIPDNICCGHCVEYYLRDEREYDLKQAQEKAERSKKAKEVKNTTITKKPKKATKKPKNEPAKTQQKKPLSEEDLQMSFADLMLAI